jgi:hypothetical protein
MSVKIEELIGIHKNKTGHCCGLGPSLSNYLESIENLNKEDNVIFCVNDFDLMTKIQPDYWVMSNPSYKIPEIASRLNKYENLTYLYADILDMTSRDEIGNYLNIKYYGYDQKHFGSKPNDRYMIDEKGNSPGPYIEKCVYPNHLDLNCCNHIVDNRLTIQELLQKVSGYHTHYNTGDTVILHALAFSVIMGCNPINIYGVDLDYTLGYADGVSRNGDSFDFWMPRIENDLNVINESAKLLGIKIINYSGSKSCKNIFENNN